MTGGAKIDTTNADRMTALMIASEREHLEVVDDLIKAGADVDAIHNQGDTALTLAIGRMKDPGYGFNRIVDYSWHRCQFGQ